MPLFNIFNTANQRQTLYAHHWKIFKFEEGKTAEDVHREHAYSKDPIASMNHAFMLLHLSDTYNFWSELVRQ